MLRYLVLVAPIYLFSCEEVPEFKPDDQLPVVEGFLYVNRSTPDITVTRVAPFGTSEEEASVGGLRISLVHKENTYALTESSDVPGRYVYNGNDLTIRSGERYDLAFDFNGRQITSNTVVPAAPEGLVVSSDEIFLPQIVSRSDIQQLIQNQANSAVVEWENPAGDYYFVTVENVANNPEAIDPNQILNFNFQFISRPTQNDFFTLRPFAQFTQFGLHRIIVYRVNEEYALLYETLEQDSRNLNEPFSNITNGVGIFTGFASDTVYLEVRKK